MKRKAEMIELLHQLFFFLFFFVSAHNGLIWHRDTFVD